MKKNYALIIFSAILAISLLSAKDVSADTCKLTGASWSKGSAETDMSKLKNGDKVNLNLSGTPEAGAAQGQGCNNFGVSFRIYKYDCQYITGGPGGVPTQVCTKGSIVTILNGKFDSEGKNATVAWTIDTKGSLDPSVSFVFVAAAGDEEKESQSITVSTGASGNKVYSCLTREPDGRMKYNCSSPPEKSGNKCQEIPVNCEANTCQQIDKNNCGQYQGSAATHKECQNNKCVSVTGAGSDTCTTSPNSCTAAGGGGGGGGGGGTGGGAPQTYVFNLLNPIGVENFQDLINIIGKWIFNLAIPIAVIIIIYAGVLMLTAGGVPARFQKGAKALWYAVLGLAVVLIGKGFVTLVQSILNLRNK